MYYIREGHVMGKLSVKMLLILYFHELESISNTPLFCFAFFRLFVLTFIACFSSDF